MSFDLTNSMNSIKAYKTVMAHSKVAPDTESFKSKITESIQKLQKTIHDDAENALKVRQTTRQMPDAKFIRNVKELETTVRRIFPNEREIPKELNAGLNQLLAITRADCTANREEAIEKLNTLPLGSYVIWPSKKYPGEFGLMQKLPGDDLSKKDAFLLQGDNLAERIQTNLVNFCDSKSTALIRYPTLEMGKCLVWPSANHPGKFGIIMKTQPKLTPEGLNTEKHYVVEQQDIVITVGQLQTDYLKQHAEKTEKKG